ncbi:MAG TPA: T9SS type A sorting domain-containing protein, partial [Candidatus Cloacimonas sp.]|nr:T9SS type A sorting domain-containing protein [Candidatus Cloacimonas sp.]HQO47206.1 T9SS type A sorting domain-containing protein [Candidatus Cloacimonas sp.]
PAGCDNGPQVEGYGNMIYMNNNWHTLTDESATLTYNWTIQVYVADASGKEYVLGELPMNNSFAEGSFGVHYTEPVRGRDVTAYKVYRDGSYLTEVDGELLTYTDTEVPGGPHTYYITAMYGTVESGASNTVSVFVLPANHYELNHDDGTAEQGFNVGATNQMAVKFDYSGEFDLKYVKVFVHTLNTAGLVIRIYDANGTGGMPGAQIIPQYQYPAASVVTGWNFITLPNPAHLNNQPFYIAIMETSNANQIGLDTSTNGFSYQIIDDTWEPVETGEIMLRAIVEGPNAGEDPTLPPLVLDAKNYPNPFNPETTISFSIPASGQTSVKIYNLKGQLVRTLVDETMNAGYQKVAWNGTDDNQKSVASGVYFYRVNNAGKIITRKMLLAK